jgi:hypothetical protein
MPPSLLHHPGEAIALIHELGEGVPPPLRSKFFERVKKLLAADEVLIPAKIVEACQKAQIELRIAPPTAEPPTVRPTRAQPPRGPFRRRA